MGKIKFGYFTVVLCLAVIISGCGGSDQTNAKKSMNPQGESFAESELSTGQAAVEAKTEESRAEDTTELVQTADSERKLINQQDYFVETREFDSFLGFLEGMVQESGGYVEYSQVSGNTYGGSGNRTANYTIRIPADILDSIHENIGEQANITQFSQQVEDVTLTYLDTESRTAALKTEQDSLLKMLEQATVLEDIFSIQSRLTEVCYQLERYESQIRTYDNQVQYSAIHLYVEEVERETNTSKSFWGQMSERLSGSFYGIASGASAAALWFLGGLPYWLLLALLGGGTYWVVKRVRRRVSRKACKPKLEENSDTKE